MPDIAHLLSEAANRKIMLWVEDGELKFRAPSGTLSEDFRDRLKRHKAELIASWPWPGERNREEALHSVAANSPGRRIQKIPAYLHPLWSQIGKGELGVHFTNATHAAIRHSGVLDDGMLSAALEQLAADHRILSARIAEPQDGPAFLFDCPLGVSLIEVDLTALPEGEREAKAKARAHALIWQPFIPTAGPLIRAFTIRITQTDHIIGFTIHHFVADLVSLRIVMSEWLLRYENLLRHGKTMQAAPALAFEDHLARMDAWTGSDAADEARAYWGGHLRNAGPTWLPRRSDTPSVKPDRLVTCPVTIGAETVGLVRRVAASRGATLFQVLVAAKIATLAEIGGMRDPTIMFFSTCRDDPKLMATVGSLMNLLHLRVAFAPEDSFDELVGKVRTAHAGAIRHQLCPFELVREIQPQVGAWNDLPYAPLFNFMDTHAPARKKNPRSGKAIASEPFDIGPAPEVALREVEFESYYFQLASEGDGLEGFLRYSPLLYADATVRQYLDAFRATLERACAHV